MKGEVEIKTSKGTMIFRLGINEMISAQDELGLASDDQGFLDALDNLKSMKRIRTIVYCGLKRDQPDVTPETAGDLITELGIPGIVEVIKQALRWALPEKEAGSGVPKRGAPTRPSLGPMSS